MVGICIGIITVFNTHVYIVTGLPNYTYTMMCDSGMIQTYTM